MAIKGTGYNDATSRNQTVAAGDTLTVDGSVSIAQDLSVTGDASVGGNLAVSGDIISRGAIDLVVQDNFIDLNFANSTTDAESGGLTIQLNRASSFTAGTVTTFTAGSGSTNPTFTNTDAGSSTPFAAGDVVVINDATDEENNGLYIVSAVSGATFPQTVTIKGVGSVAVNGATPWAQTQFTAATGNTATAFKTDIFIQLVANGEADFTDSTGTTYAKGTFLTAYHGNATEDDFTADGGYTTVESTLQSAYNGGATIVTAGGRDIALTLSDGDFTIDSGSVNMGGTAALAAFNLDTSGAITVDSSGAGVSLQGAAASDFTTSAGALTLSGVGVNVAGGNAEIDVTTTGALDLNSAGFTLDASTVSIDSTDTTNLTMTANDAAAKVLSIDASNSGSGNGSLSMTAKSAININATGTASTVIGNSGSNDVTIDSAGIVSIDAGDASNFTVAGATLSIGTTTSGELDLTSAGLLDINAGANLDINVTGTYDMLATSTFAIAGTGSSSIGTTSGNLSLSTTTGGEIDLTSAGSIDLNATNDATIDADGSISLDAADNSNLTLAASNAADKTLTISVANSGSGSGVLDIDSDGAITIDAGAGLSLDAAAASNFTTSAGALTLDGNGGVNIAGNAAEIDITTTGTVDVNSAAFDLDASGNISIDTSNNNASALSLTTNGGSSEKIAITNTQGTAADAIGIQAIAGGIQIAAEGPNASALILADNPQLARNVNANATVAVGDVLYFVFASSELRVDLADADGAASSRVAGVALSSGNAGDSVVVCLAGIVTMTCTASVTNADIGNPVYLSTTSGRIQKTAPSATSQTVFQVGICLGGTGTAWNVLLQPQYIMELG